MEQRMRRELNDAMLRALRPPVTGRLELWDTRVAGLVLRITVSGTASWSVRARTRDGKRTRPTLGGWPEVGIAAARKRARATLADIQGGADPVVAKRDARADRVARAAQPTVADRLAEWRSAKETDKGRPWSNRYASEVRRLVGKEIIPRIGRLPLVATTRADWTRLVASKRRTAPALASLLYRVASAFLGHAEAHGWISAPLLPRKGLASLAPPASPRERVLTDEDLRNIWLATDKANPKPRAFVRLLILTASREMEAADIAIGEIDVIVGTWTIPAARAKNRRAITVPLHKLAMAELLPLWPEHGEVAGPGWRLLGDIAGSGVRGFSKLKTSIDKHSGVSGWRWHDLRRTARTGLARLGVPPEHAEAALNHISGRSSLQRTYDKHNFADEIISALGRWQAHVASLVSATPTADVIALRRAR
jgi:integrase